MGIKRILQKDQGTEARIKEAARQLFTRKGYAATRTRDIAEAAGINLALLNYYFRSKEKLYDLVMRENILLFINGMLDTVRHSEHLGFEEKFSILIDRYIETLIENPDLPLFILSISRSEADAIEHSDDPLFAGMKELRAFFMKELEAQIRLGRLIPVHPLHFMANLMGMIVFPFAASNLLKARTGISQAEFERLMRERKQLIPVWLKAMFIQPERP